MNRQLRRITEKDERRQRQTRAKAAQQRASIRKRASLWQFLREVRQELKRVSWPTPQEVWTFSVVTVITTTAITLIVFGMDIVFKRTVLELIRSLQ